MTRITLIGGPLDGASYDINRADDYDWIELPVWPDLPDAWTNVQSDVFTQPARIALYYRIPWVRAGRKGYRWVHESVVAGLTN